MPLLLSCTWLVIPASAALSVDDVDLDLLLGMIIGGDDPDQTIDSRLEHMLNQIDQHLLKSDLISDQLAWKLLRFILLLYQVSPR